MNEAVSAAETATEPKGWLNRTVVGAGITSALGDFCYKTTTVMLPGLVSLLAFAALLTRIDVDLAGRAYAAYGGIYIVASLAWLWGVEGQSPDQWDLAGASLCLLGALVILISRHSG